MNWRRLFPWRARAAEAHRDASAAAHEADLIRSRRPMVERIAYELGKHRHDNHFVDIVQAVAKGIR